MTRSLARPDACTDGGASDDVDAAALRAHANAGRVELA
jgi:hypothetical protein